VQPAEKTMIAMTASTIGTEVGFIFSSASGSVDSSFGTSHDKRFELWVMGGRTGGGPGSAESTRERSQQELMKIHYPLFLLKQNEPDARKRLVGFYRYALTGIRMR
jgi:hypothetical protein